MKLVTSILMAIAWLALSASVTTAEYIYLNEGSGVFRFNDDGTGRTELFSGSSLSGLALDAAAGKLYVGDASGEIQSAALDGSALTDVVSIGAHTYQPYFELALDSTDGKIFWTDQVNQHIDSANLSGPANVQTLASGIVGAQNIRGIAIDPASEHIYWGDATAHTLNMAKADGTGVTTIGSGYWDITSLVVDEAAHRLFFGETGYSLGRMPRERFILQISTEATHTPWFQAWAISFRSPLTPAALDSIRSTIKSRCITQTSTEAGSSCFLLNRTP